MQECHHLKWTNRRLRSRIRVLEFLIAGFSIEDLVLAIIIVESSFYLSESGQEEIGF